MRGGSGEDLDTTQRLRIKNAPPPLPSQRPRALTLPLSRPSSIKTKDSWNPLKKRNSEQQRTNDQMQSFLYLKLPPEVRKQIWEEILGHKWLHIVRAPKRLLGIECLEIHDDISAKSPRRTCACWGLTTGRISLGETPGFFIEPRKDSKSTTPKPLPLLQTCRKIYSEAIGILYSTNTFHIDHLDTLLYMATTILPHRLHSIRSLDINWYIKYPMYPIIETAKPTDGYGPPYNAATWDEVWRIVANNMEGLRELHVYLNGLGVAPKQYGKLLEPLTEVRQIPVFEVVLPKWPKFSGKVEIPNAPFKIIEEADA